MDKRILIGMPCQSGVVPVQMVQSLLQLHKPLPCAFISVERQRVDKARNHIALEALRGGFDYLFFVDDDNPIPPDTLEKLLEDDKDVILAPILSRSPGKDGKYTMCAFYSEMVEANGKPLRLYFPIDKFREEGPLHKVDGAGSGCILIKRKVLEVLGLKYKNDIYEFGDIRFPKITYKGGEYDRRTMSEDCEFSERAIDAGFEVWVDDRIRPIHISGSTYVQWKGENA